MQHKLDYPKLSIDLIDYLFSIKGNGIFKEWIDLNKKQTLGKVMVDDLGDTSPFAYYVYDNYSINNNKKDEIDLYTKYVIKKYQQENGLFITNRDLEVKNNSYLNIFNSDKMSDIAVGLNLMFQLTNDIFYKNSSIRFFNGLENINIVDYPIAYMKYGFVKVPWFSGKWDGLYMEEKVNLYKITDDQQYIDSAMRSAMYWINTKFFKKYGLFSFESTPFFKPVMRSLFKQMLNLRFDIAMSSKANTNLIFGLTELYLITNDKKLKNALLKWVNATDNLLLHNDGYFYSFWSEIKGPSYVFLGHDHAMIDALLDIYLSTGFEKALIVAKSNIDYWLSRQTDEGYFPQGAIGEKVLPPNRLLSNRQKAKWLKGETSNMARLDIHTDYGVMLLKMYEITGDKKYFDACKSMIEGLVKHSSYSGAYVDIINTKTLKKDYFLIETKFLFLLTKLFTAFDLIEKNGSIYNNSLFKSLIRDR